MKEHRQESLLNWNLLDKAALQVMMSGQPLLTSKAMKQPLLGSFPIPPALEGVPYIPQSLGQTAPPSASPVQPTLGEVSLMSINI